MKLEVGKFYKTRDGRKAEVVYINESLAEQHQVVIYLEGSTCVSFCKIDGVYSAGYRCGKDLISEWKEPVRVCGWFNVYPGEDGFELYHFRTKEEAEKVAGLAIIGQIYIDKEL